MDEAEYENLATFKSLLRHSPACKAYFRKRSAALAAPEFDRIATAVRAKTEQKAFAAGRAEVLRDFRAMSALNGSGGRVVKALEEMHGADDGEGSADPHAALALSLIDQLILDKSADPESHGGPVYHYLAGLLHDPGALSDALKESGGGVEHKALALAVGTVILKAHHGYKEELHPRNKEGRWISKDQLHQAKSDPALAAKLRDEVRPSDAGKLEKVLSGETEVSPTKRGEQRQQAAQRQQTKADRLERVKQIRLKVGRLEHSIGDIQELAEHLPHLTVDELRKTRLALQSHGAGFGGARTREAMAAALLAHATRIADEMDWQDRSPSSVKPLNMTGGAPSPDDIDREREESAEDVYNRRSAWLADKPNDEAARGATASAAARVDAAKLGDAPPLPPPPVESREEWDGKPAAEEKPAEPDQTAPDLSADDITTKPLKDIADKVTREREFERRQGHRILTPAAVWKDLADLGHQGYQRGKPKAGVPGRSGVTVNEHPTMRTAVTVSTQPASHEADGYDYTGKADEIAKQLTARGYTVTRNPNGDQTILYVRKPLTEQEKVDRLPKPTGHDPAASYAVDSKEPWEMTAKEWHEAKDAYKPYDSGGGVGHVGPQVDARIKNRTQTQLDRSAKLRMNLPDVPDESAGGGLGGKRSVGHREVVAAALAAGKPVPAEVLADYPDLKPASGAHPLTLGGMAAAQSAERAANAPAYTPTDAAGHERMLAGYHSGVERLPVSEDVKADLKRQLSNAPVTSRARLMAEFARKYGDRPKVEYVRAPAGGKVSDVDGKHYAGGQLMPTHGLYSGQAKPPKGDGVGTGDPVKPNEDAEKPAPRQPAQPLTPEQIQAKREASERQKKWDEMNAGPLGKINWLGNSPNAKAAQPGVHYDKWKEFAASVGPEGVQRIISTLEPHFHAAVDSTTRAAREQLAARQAERGPSVHDTPIAADTEEWAKNEPKRRADEDAGMFARGKKHERDVPGSHYARQLITEMMDPQNSPGVDSVDRLHRLNALLAHATGDSSAPQAKPAPAAAQVTAPPSPAFADAVHAAAGAMPHDYAGNARGAGGVHKVLVSDLYDTMAKNGSLPPGTTLDAFKAQLLDAQQAGALDLGRLDLPQILERQGRMGELSRSEVKHPTGAEFHLVNVPSSAPSPAAAVGEWAKLKERGARSDAQAAEDPPRGVNTGETPAQKRDRVGAARERARAETNRQRAKKYGPKTGHPATDAALVEHRVASGKTREALAAALHNVGVEDPYKPPKDHAPDPALVLRRFASAHRELAEGGHDTSPLDRVLAAHGARPVGTPGEEVSFDGSVHDGPPGVFTGDRVRVVHPGFEMDRAGLAPYTPLKASVVPVTHQKAVGHDVSGEARDDAGKWTAGGGYNGGMDATTETIKALKAASGMSAFYAIYDKIPDAARAEILKRVVPHIPSANSMNLYHALPGYDPAAPPPSPSPPAAKGRDRVVWHGTPDEFDAPDVGSYWTSGRNAATIYTRGQGGYLHEGRISPDANMKDFGTGSWNDDDVQEYLEETGRSDLNYSHFVNLLETADFREFLRGKGYDGFTLEEESANATDDGATRHDSVVPLVDGVIKWVKRHKVRPPKR